MANTLVQPYAVDSTSSFTVSNLTVSGTLTSSGITLQSGNTATRPVSPTVGTMRFNTTTGLAEIYSNLYGWIVCGIPASVTWTTPAGSLGTVLDYVGTYSFQLVATDGTNATLTYSLSSGTLPPNATLVSSTGYISGTVSALNSSTTYSFSITASNAFSAVTRAFTITLAPANYFGSGADGAGVY